MKPRKIFLTYFLTGFIVGAIIGLIAIHSIKPEPIKYDAPIDTPTTVNV